MTDHDDRTVQRILGLAAGLVLLEGLALLAYGVAELLAARGGDATIAVSVGLFFGGYGTVHVVAARALWRRESWARGLILATQLIQLGIAWSLRSDPPALAAALAVVALTVLAAVLSRPVSDALAA